MESVAAVPAAEAWEVAVEAGGSVAWVVAAARAVRAVGRVATAATAGKAVMAEEMAAHTPQCRWCYS